MLRRFCEGLACIAVIGLIGTAFAVVAVSLLFRPPQLNLGPPRVDRPR